MNVVENLKANLPAMLVFGGVGFGMGLILEKKNATKIGLIVAGTVAIGAALGNKFPGSTSTAGEFAGQMGGMGGGMGGMGQMQCIPRMQYMHLLQQGQQPQMPMCHEHEHGQFGQQGFGQQGFGQFGHHPGFEHGFGHGEFGHGGFGHGHFNQNVQHGFEHMLHHLFS